MLADIPGVTVQQVTDVTGQADLAFRFPFTDGVTEILLNASTHQFAGYVRGGVQTVITKEVAVSGPGSHTPVMIHPKPALLPPTRLRGRTVAG
jgi:L-aminopeptidase/D-esterase-like protein